MLKVLSIARLRQEAVAGDVDARLGGAGLKEGSKENRDRGGTSSAFLSYISEVHHSG